MKSVPKHKVSEVMRLVKTIHAQEGMKSARQKAAQVVQKLQEMKLSKAAKIVYNGADETFSYYDFPPQHWQHIRTPTFDHLTVQLLIAIKAVCMELVVYLRRPLICTS